MSQIKVLSMLITDYFSWKWCLASCLTEKSACPQALIDACPPCRSLIEHKAYTIYNNNMRGWLPTVCAHVDFSHAVSYLGEAMQGG